MSRPATYIMAAALVVALLVFWPKNAVALPWLLPLYSPVVTKPSAYDIPEATFSGTPKYDAIISRGIRTVAREYGPAIARNVERIFRLETAHFTSQGWRQTLGAGMHPWANTFPYGWTSVQDLWDQYPEYRPIGVAELTEGGTGKSRWYLVFQGIGGFMSLAEYLSHYGNNAGRWYSTNAAQQAYYESKLQNITTHYA